jgi:hypothetical protein
MTQRRGILDANHCIGWDAAKLGHVGCQLPVTCGTAIEQIPVRFAASSREWNDYEVMLPWFGPKTYQPWIPALDEQFGDESAT